MQRTGKTTSTCARRRASTFDDRAAGGARAIRAKAEAAGRAAGIACHGVSVESDRPAVSSVAHNARHRARDAAIATIRDEFDGSGDPRFDRLIDGDFREIFAQIINLAGPLDDNATSDHARARVAPSPEALERDRVAAIARKSNDAA